MKFRAEINDAWFNYEGSDAERRQSIRTALTGIDLDTDPTTLKNKLEDALAQPGFKAPGMDDRTPMAKPLSGSGVEVRDYAMMPTTIARYLPE